MFALYLLITQLIMIKISVFQSHGQFSKQDTLSIHFYNRIFKVREENYSTKQISRARKIYLSREKLKDGFRPVVNERKISAEFERLGYTIIYPEKLDFISQLQIIESADIIAGFIGSAFHSILFTSKPKKLIC